MSVGSWIHRFLTGNARRTKRGDSAVKRRNAARGGAPRRRPSADQLPRPSRREQYDSEFITRYGDPFD